MPNLCPGIKPLYPSGQRLLCLCLIVFLPCFLFAQPAISSVSPLNGPVGTTVTITGNNFNASPSANIVYFGSTQAQVTAASATSLTVTAPNGNNYQPLTVTTGGLTAYAWSPFITTFSDPNQFNAQAFASSINIPTGNGPQSIYSMDMDGDGKPDLLVADGDSITVEVYRNTSTPGSPSFALQVDSLLPSGNYPVGITAGDLDGDGKPDVVVTNFGSNQLVVFRNISTPGSIGFAPAVYYTTGNYTLSAAIADCNGDGKPDIVVASAVDDMLSIFVNNSTTGNLSFPTRQDLTMTDGGFPINVIAGDLNGDGMPELACVDAVTSNVSVFRNTATPGGAVSFATNVDFAVGNTPTQLVVGDMDGDGKPDIATANSGDGTISLLQNTSSAGTLAFVRGTDVAEPNGPWSLVMADFDGDQKPDLASINQLSHTVSVYRNVSIPGNLAVAASVDYPDGNGVPWFITSADYDGDGMPDLATIDNTLAAVTVLVNTSSAKPVITSFTPGSGSTGTVVTIVGVNLNGATSVSFGGTAASAYTIVSADTITATVGAGATGLVSVVTPTGTASLGNFTFGLPTPAITSFSPDSGTTGTTVLIHGTNFSGVSSVTFGGTTASFSIISDSVISAKVGAGASGNVVVTAPGGPASMAGFIYTIPPPPAFSFSTFTPTNGSTGTNILIKGTGLLNLASVTFGGVSASNIAVISDTMAIATVGSGASGEVTLTSSASLIDSLPGFTYTASAPPPPPPGIKLISFSPGTGGSGTSITIKGTNLKGATGVSFGGVPSLAFSIVSDSVIVAVVGTGATGALKVANPTSIDSLNGFVFQNDTAKPVSKTFQLLSFTGALNSNQPQLKWTVQDDASISYYAVERSPDSLQFFIIGTVPSIRSNGANHSYALTDQSPTKGTSYYRLRMQDTTAFYTYSYTISVQLTPLPVHPNPVKYGFFYVDLPTADSPSQFQLSDLSGKVLQTISEPAGLSRVRIDVPGLANGTYVLSWTNGKRSARQPILVLSP
ncbi:MAG TPA: FG-GAP-like repeat-containing protein [Puia sp.]|nr:FG-GAP-like repeat-containing protein [Puia sp.]